MENINPLSHTLQILRWGLKYGWWMDGPLSHTLQIPKLNLKYGWFGDAIYRFSPSVSFRHNFEKS